MQVNSVKGSNHPHFTAISSFPLKKDVNAVLNVITNRKHMIKKISCDIYEKENVLNQSSYTWKNGITAQMLDSAAEKICKDLKLPKDETHSIMLHKLLEAYKHDIMIYQ